MQSSDDKLTRRLLPSVGERARVGALFFIGASLLLVIADSFSGNPDAPIMVSVNVARVLCFGAIYFYLLEPRGERRESFVALVGLAILAFSAVVMEPMRGDYHPNVVVTIGSVLGAAAMVPWSVGYQIATVVVLSSALLATLLSLGEVARPALAPSPVFAYAVTMVGSIYLSVVFGLQRKAARLAAEEVGRSHDETRRMNEILEQRVSERTADLASANRDLAAANRDLAAINRDLEEAYRELEGFTHSVSHDIRVPLRVIHGLSRLTLEEQGGALDETGRGYLERIGQAAVRLGVIGDDLLTLSRVTRAPMRVVAVDLAALAADVVAGLRDGSKNAAGLAAGDGSRDVNVTIEEGIVADGDPQLLRIVLEHLLGNAWKFTRTREQAIVHVGRLAADGERGLFVRDNGIGFAPEFARKLFGRFERLHDDPDIEGTGIGLATVQRIVHRHGGRVWAEGQAGKGATISFCLPDPPQRGGPLAPSSVVVLPAVSPNPGPPA